jgi:hypothetical protein
LKNECHEKITDCLTAGLFAVTAAKADPPTANIVETAVTIAEIHNWRFSGTGPFFSALEGEYRICDPLAKCVFS